MRSGCTLGARHPTLTSGFDLPTWQSSACHHQTRYALLQTYGCHATTTAAAATLTNLDLLPSLQLAFEARAATSAGSAPSALQPKTRVQRLLAGLRSAGSIGLTVGRYGLLAALVAFKLAEWWFTNEEALYPTAASGTARALVPAPLPPSQVPRVRSCWGLWCVVLMRVLVLLQHPGAVVALPKHRGKCPLCRKLRTNPAASSAGVVYCYGCIFKHASKHGTCAATGQPCSVEQIRKLHTN